MLFSPVENMRDTRNKEDMLSSVGRSQNGSVTPENVKG